MSGFVSVNRYTFKMTISEQDILRTLMKSRDRIAAAAWVVVRDAHAAEDIFQNVALKALTKEISFEAEGAVLSWAFITARREGIDWLRRHRKESTGPVHSTQIQKGPHRGRLIVPADHRGGTKWNLHAA